VDRDALLDEDQLVQLGLSLGASLASGEVVWLVGELGAGKTTLAQAIVRGLGVEETVTSPTYDLVHRYPSPGGSVYHVDCYRLRRPAEAAALDWEALTSGRALLVEWPDRGGSWVARPNRRIELEHVDDPGRRRVRMEDGGR